MKILHIVKWFRLLCLGATTICMLLLLVFFCEKFTLHIQTIKQNKSASINKMYDPEVSPYLIYDVTYDVDNNLGYSHRAVYHIPVPPEILERTNHFIERYQLFEKAELINEHINRLKFCAKEKRKNVLREADLQLRETSQAMKNYYYKLRHFITPGKQYNIEAI